MSSNAFNFWKAQEQGNTSTELTNAFKPTSHQATPQREFRSKTVISHDSKALPQVPPQREKKAFLSQSVDSSQTISTNEQPIVEIPQTQTNTTPNTPQRGVPRRGASYRGPRPLPNNNNNGQVRGTPQRGGSHRGPRPLASTNPNASRPLPNTNGQIRGTPQRGARGQPGYNNIGGMNDGPTRAPPQRGQNLRRSLPPTPNRGSMPITRGTPVRGNSSQSHRGPRPLPNVNGPTKAPIAPQNTIQNRRSLTELPKANSVPVEQFQGHIKQFENREEKKTLNQTTDAVFVSEVPSIPSIPPPRAPTTPKINEGSSEEVREISPTPVGNSPSSSISLNKKPLPTPQKKPNIPISSETKAISPPQNQKPTPPPRSPESNRRNNPISPDFIPKLPYREPLSNENSSQSQSNESITQSKPKKKKGGSRLQRLRRSFHGGSSDKLDELSISSSVTTPKIDAPTPPISKPSDQIVNNTNTRSINENNNNNHNHNHIKPKLKNDDVFTNDNASSPILLRKPSYKKLRGVKQEIVRAVVSFDSGHRLKLSYGAGDEIVVIEKFPTGWWKGELNGVTAFFQEKNTTTINEDEDDSSSSSSNLSSSNLTGGIGVSEYKPNIPISPRGNGSSTPISMVKDKPAALENDDNTSVITPAPTPHVPKVSPPRKSDSAVALHNFEKQGEHEIYLTQGEIVEVVKVIDSWTFVKSQTNGSGYVPTAYLQFYS